MALLTTIFALVFLTELISWIGKSVLLEFVRHLYVRRTSNATRIDPRTQLGLRVISSYILFCETSKAKDTQVGDPHEQERAAADQRSGPVCQVGKAEEKCG